MPRVCESCGCTMARGERRRRCPLCNRLVCYTCLQGRPWCRSCAAERNLYVAGAAQRPNHRFHDVGAWVCGGLWVWGRLIRDGTAFAPRTTRTGRSGRPPEDADRAYHGGNYS